MCNTLSAISVKIASISITTTKDIPNAFINILCCSLFSSSSGVMVNYFVVYIYRNNVANIQKMNYI